MSSFYVVTVDVQDNAASNKTFQLEAILSVWDVSQIWEVIYDDLKLRNYRLVSIGKEELWENVRHWWPNNGLIDQMAVEAAKATRALWCKDKIPV